MKLHLYVLFLLPSFAFAQSQPEKPPSFAELNKRAVEVLRIMHDRGADLYNAGDAAGAVKVYRTALGTVTPFISHHPAIAKAIADGLADADKLEGEKARAFKLHEVIEQVRADLRTESKKLEEEPNPKPPVPPSPKGTIPSKPPEDKKPKLPPPPPKPAGAELFGTVTFKGKPLAGVDVTVVSLNLPTPKVFTTKTDDRGEFTFPALQEAEYAAIVTGPNVPAKYQTTDLSKFRAKVSGTGTTLNLLLE